MLGYNTAFYDLDTKHWYWDEVNSQAATCYIKFSEQYYDYIRPWRPHIVSFDPINDKELVIPIYSIIDKELIIAIAKCFPTAEVLEDIVKHITPLYNHVMFKEKSIVELHPTSNKTRGDEFQIKTVPKLELPVLRIGNGIITDHIDFSLTLKNNDFMNISLQCTVNVCL